MRQIARWYDVDIIYQGKNPSVCLKVSCPGHTSIENIIKLLKVNNINARLNEKDRTIIVTS